MMDLVVNHTAKDSPLIAEHPGVVRPGRARRGAEPLRGRSRRPDEGDHLGRPGRDRQRALARPRGAVGPLGGAGARLAGAGLPRLPLRRRVQGAGRALAAADRGGAPGAPRRAVLRGDAGRAAGGRGVAQGGGLRLLLQLQQVVGLPRAVGAGAARGAAPHRPLGRLPRVARHHPAGRRHRRRRGGAAAALRLRRGLLRRGDAAPPATSSASAGRSTWSRPCPPTGSAATGTCAPSWAASTASSCATRSSRARACCAPRAAWGATCWCWSAAPPTSARTRRAAGSWSTTATPPPRSTWPTPPPAPPRGPTTACSASAATTRRRRARRCRPPCAWTAPRWRTCCRR